METDQRNIGMKDAIPGDFSKLRSSFVPYNKKIEDVRTYEPGKMSLNT
jgi:hypothetical protein